MSTKRDGIILLAVIFTFCIAGGLAGCTIGENKANLENSVRYNGIDYVIQEDMGLNFEGFHDLYEGINEMCVKVVSLRHAEVYRIHGLEQSDWIFLDNNAMLSSDDPNGGIYRSPTVKMDSIADFKPDSLDVYYLSPPTSSQSGTETLIFDTADPEIIEKIVTAIEKGRPVPAEKQAEVAKVMIYGDSRYRSYRLAFFSKSYPNLVYRLDYTEDANGKFYIGLNGDITAHEIIEIEHTLHEVLPAETSSGEQSASN